MKALIAVIFGLFMFSANAEANDKHYPVAPHHNHHYRHHLPDHYRYVQPRAGYPVYPSYYYAPAPVYVNRGDWVAPLVGGVVLGAVINEVVNERRVVEQPVQTCTEWREIQQPDGRIVRERNCYQR